MFVCFFTPSLRFIRFYSYISKYQVIMVDKISKSKCDLKSLQQDSDSTNSVSIDKDTIFIVSIGITSLKM